MQGDVLTVSQVKSGGNPPFIKSTTFGENATTDFFVFERNSINYVEITGEGAGTITHQFQGKNAGNSTSSRALTVQGSVAPVTWTKLLTYAAAGDAVELHWSVADQVDVEGYEIQRSTGETFETISSVPYRENGSLEVNYTALLEQSESDAYYRVKQLDYAGTFDYSNVIYVPGQQSKTALAIFPNPARDFVRMAVPERVNTVQLISATGQVIRDYPAAAARDGIDVSDLVSGMYLLRTDDSNFAPQRLIVQK
ncbi:hypothetical protein GGR28_000821 [Lewinella aquimaris]|uniref:Secretion system C-terminal sorting domain-containing protein n=1 Tax=Neolewinella aquimaris TaxID=1835722 RepID=A0A840DZ86_9BACT|nr:T9SS type A sorting domain-containing protein [Neolewinella aquimaris]MBB4078220.1 hypothetical protein [Neolewinella aquimaris]